MDVFTQFTDPHLYYRQSNWLKNREKIKKKIRRKKIAQKLKEDKEDTHLYILIIILIIILNLVIYNDKHYFDEAEKVFIY